MHSCQCFCLSYFANAVIMPRAGFRWKSPEGESSRGSWYRKVRISRVRWALRCWDHTCKDVGHRTVQSSRNPIESAMVPSRCMEDILRGVLQQAADLEGRIALLHCKKKIEIWRMYQSNIILHEGISGNSTHVLSSLFGSILAFVALLGKEGGRKKNEGMKRGMPTIGETT